MKLVTVKPKIFSPEWEKLCVSSDYIPDNTMFLSYSFDDKNKLKLSHYLKFNNQFYYFKEKDSSLSKVSSKHKFHKITSSNQILVSDIQEEDLDNFWRKYINLCQKQSEEKANSYELTEEDIKAFKINGIKAQPVLGATGFTKESSAVYYDDVQYCIRFYGNNYQDKKDSIKRVVNTFTQIKERHQQLIKDIYTHLVKTLNTDEVYVVPCGGARIQVEFGYKYGHLGHLDLDMDTSEQNIKQQHFDSFNLVLNKSNTFFSDFKHDKLNIIYR